jgi:hypothetical protein
MSWISKPGRTIRMMVIGQVVDFDDVTTPEHVNRIRCAIHYLQRKAGTVYRTRWVAPKLRVTRLL